MPEVFDHKEFFDCLNDDVQSISEKARIDAQEVMLVVERGFLLLSKESEAVKKVEHLQHAIGAFKKLELEDVDLGEMSDVEKLYFNILSGLSTFNYCFLAALIGKRELPTFVRRRCLEMLPEDLILDDVKERRGAKNFTEILFGGIEVDEEVFRHYFVRGNDRTRAYLLGRRECPVDVVEGCTGENDPNLRRALGHCKCGVEILRRYYDFFEDDNETQVQILRNPNCPADIVVKEVYSHQEGFLKVNFDRIMELGLRNLIQLPEEVMLDVVEQTDDLAMLIAMLDNWGASDKVLRVLTQRIELVRKKEGLPREDSLRTLLRQMFEVVADDFDAENERGLEERNAVGRGARARELREIREMPVAMNYLRPKKGPLRMSRDLQVPRFSAMYLTHCNCDVDLLAELMDHWTVDREESAFLH